MGLGFFVLYALLLLHALGVLNGLVTPNLWDLINLINEASFPYTNIDSYVPQIITDFREAFTPWGGFYIWTVWLGNLFNSCSDFETRFPYLNSLLDNFADYWDWILLKLILWLVASSKVYHSNGSIFDFWMEGVLLELGNIEILNHILQFFLQVLPECILRPWPLGSYTCKVFQKIILRILIHVSIDLILWSSDRIYKYIPFYFYYSNQACRKICILFSFIQYDCCSFLIRDPRDRILVKPV